jgi:hypothetical protein
MRFNNHTSGIVVAVAMAALVPGGAEAQTADVRRVEIVSVDGNTLVVRGERGPERLTVTDDFRITVDGRPIAVSDLKPGMAGTARITTTTRARPAEQSTDVKHGTIVKRSGTSVVARLPEGEKTYTDEELAARNIPVTVDGKPVRMSSLWEGTRLIETTVTTMPEQTVTERRVDLTLAAPRVATTDPAPSAASAAPEPVPLVARVEPEPAPAQRLPTTASPLAAVGILGLACSAAGVLLAIRRRRSVSLFGGA